jgi:hypothetical protein
VFARQGKCDFQERGQFCYIGSMFRKLLWMGCQTVGTKKGSKNGENKGDQPR